MMSYDCLIESFDKRLKRLLLCMNTDLKIKNYDEVYYNNMRRSVISFFFFKKKNVFPL